MIQPFWRYISKSYSLCPSLLIPARTSLWGAWSPRFGLQSSPRHRWERRRDLTGVQFTAATASEPPFVTTLSLEAGTAPPPGYLVQCITCYLLLIHGLC